MVSGSTSVMLNTSSCGCALGDAGAPVVRLLLYQTVTETSLIAIRERERRKETLTRELGSVD